MYRIVKILNSPFPYVAQRYHPVLEMWLVINIHVFKLGAKLSIAKHAIQNAKYAEGNYGDNLTKEV